MRPALALLSVIVLVLASGTSARADDVRPVTLDIRETARETYAVRWQTPMRAGARLRAKPLLPAGSVPAPDSYSHRKAGDSLIERWTFALDGGLAGQAVGIQGLALSARNAVVSVRLRDGRTHRGVLSGARSTFEVPLPPSLHRTAWPNAWSRAFRDGFAHVVTSPAHLLFAVALALAGGLAALAYALLAFLLAACGGGIAGPIPGLTPGLAEGLVAVAGAVVAREVILARPARRLLGLAAAAGFACGAATFPGLSAGPMVAGAVGVDAAHLLVAAVVLLASRLWARPAARQAAGYVVGSVAMAAAIASAVAAAPLPPTEEGSAPLISLPVSEVEAAPPTPLPQASVEDLQVFLDVSVFETRLEVLVRLETLEPWLEGAPESAATIPIAAQGELLDRASAALRERFVLRIDGRGVTPDAERRGFVRRDDQGTYLREVPAAESRAEAIVGLAYAFATPGIPQAVDVEWKELPPRVAEVRARILDPEVSVEAALTPDAPRIEWRNALEEDPLPPVEAVRVRAHSSPLPVLSAAVLILVIGAAAALLLWHHPAGASLVARMGVAAGLLLAPLATADVPGLVPPQTVPTAVEARAISTALLENVYRAFNYREEAVVYERMSSSLAPEALERAYLENRKTLAVQRVGGALAHVDVVELVSTDDPAPAPNGGFRVEAEWAVAGSVTHFGHRHLRQNLYRGSLHIAPIAGHWKIRKIEVTDTERRR